MTKLYNTLKSLITTKNTIIMKTKITTSLFFLFLVIFSIYAQQDSSKIIGTWKLISLKHENKEILISSEDSIQRIKFITQSNFVWIQYLKNTKVVRNSLGGSYTFKDNNYVEKINFVGLGNIDLIDAINTFKVKFVDDQMYISGKLSTGVFIDEIWKKMDVVQTESPTI